jgi:starvation-inducible DNA-binding protein
LERPIPERIIVTTTPNYTVPGIKNDTAAEIIAVLQQRLYALNDLALTLKHIHWNVVGPQFIAVHTMLDPQVEGVRAMVDTTAERIATLGGSPNGTPGTLVAERTWDDYSIGRAGIDATEESDPVTQDMLIAQAAELEQYQWFVRAHLENSDGSLLSADAHTEEGAAKAASSKSTRSKK